MKLKRKFKQNLFYYIIGIILLISIYLDTFLIIKYNVLPFKYLFIYTLIVGIIPIFMILFTIFKKKSKLKIAFSCIEVLYVILLSVGFFYLNKTFNFLDNFTSMFNYETKNYYVVTLASNNYGDIKDLENKDLGYVKESSDSSEKYILELEKKISFNKKELSGNGDMLAKLTTKDIDGMIIEQGYYEVLIENIENGEDYKITYTFSIKEKIDNIEKDVNVTKDTFNIYITGIDSYGSVTDNTRSDVNIIMSVNPSTNKVLLVNIPRDYYVTLAGYNEKDKLTHAGTYGVKTSIGTIENLLDIEINYYVKVNYNALIDLVNALDGVDVESEYDFTSYEYHYRFKTGMNHVDGKMALDFVRTRKAFRNGDRVRGENQQRMIKAILDKVLSPSILLKYGDLLKAIEGNFATNISTDRITSLINMQLDKMPKWEFETISLDGKDSLQMTYSFKGQELYVMIPDEETVNMAKEKLRENK